MWKVFADSMRSLNKLYEEKTSQATRSSRREAFVFKEKL
jgi:hypothetical protein